ncbi:Pescadillo homolog [Strongyloides ratti]|uniref:Pescadillo homolog n=1 Tax=Strongyloides ratti TaxID=34506 RepID=A0A090LJR6_STRRB|nr:Pescadillo homolog [Strongyloides ratti]CEF68373.1 Pescadillo homolog [Strongyloides ratti]
MVRAKKKYTSGNAANFIDRAEAISKLQVTFDEFTRLCVLKGIYPREPRNRRKAAKGVTNEPLITTLRHYNAFVKKVAKVKGRNEKEKLERLTEKEPEFNVEHLVRERYPTFDMAVRDLDDCLSVVFAFATLPKDVKIGEKIIENCRRLSSEFMHYVVESKSLRKTFISIKGIYYQAEILGEKVTWIVGHERPIGGLPDVDFTIMKNFAHFYSTALRFINFKLYKNIGLFYPPEFETGKIVKGNLDDEEKMFFLAKPLARANQEEEVVLDDFNDETTNAVIEQVNARKKLKTLFEGCLFFLNREVPKEALAFVIRSAGGSVTWDGCIANPLPSSSTQITHHVIDRPLKEANISRAYIQPQWVFDSFNAREQLPLEKYLPGVKLPSHLSPFVEEKIGDYIPQERLEQLKKDGKDVSKFIAAEVVESVPQIVPNTTGEKGKKKEKKEGMHVETGKVYKESTESKIAEVQSVKKMQEMMMPKKHKRVYKKMTFGIKRKEKEVKKLVVKKKKLEETTTN